MSVKTAPYKNRTLGVDCYVQVPVTLDDLIAASNPANVHFAAVKHSFYQGWNNKYRKAMVAKLVETTGVAIPSSGKQKKNRAGDISEILISEGDYIKLVLQGKGSPGDADYQAPAISETDYAVLGQQVADTIPFEVSKAEEEAEPDARFFSLARNVLAKAESGALASDGATPFDEAYFVTRWQAANPGYLFENLGGWTEDGIARAIEIDEKRRQMELPLGLM